MLKLGLKFCPTPKSNITELKGDLKDFERKLRLRELLMDSNITEDSIVRNKSTFCPKKGRNRELDSYFEKLWSLDLKSKRNVKNNLSQNQLKALYDLINNTNITIKEADKGGAIVIMNTDYYLSKIQDMLNDPNNYRQISENIDRNIISKIKKHCSKHKHILTIKETDYITNFISKTSNFYGLPKLHKSIEIETAILAQKSEYIELLEPKDLKFRPIVAGPSCPTHRLSNITDILLQPFLEKVKSYTRDNLHFLNLLPQHTDPDTLLVTFDVTSLYSNIPHDLGKRAISYWIRKHPELLPSRFNEQFIIDSIDIILNNNSFKFDDKNYLQTLGTAMGTKVAPIYATLTMAYLEETLYDKIEEKYGEEIKKTFIELWRRYLDDCFILWNPAWGNIDDLHSILQDLHTHFNFTMDKNSEEIPFLDILIKKDHQGNISTDIYRKPTDTQQYLHFRSQHPKNTIKSIPYILARRICTIVSDTNLREIRLHELSQTLKQRGYPTTIIEKGIDLANQIPISELRNPSKKEKDFPLAYVSTHNIANPELFQEIMRNMDQLHNNERLKKLLENTKIIKSKRQPKNLKQILTKAYTGKPHKNSVTKCNKANCGVCDVIIEADTYQFKNHPVPFKINRNLTCDSRNVVYAMECAGCDQIYIGLSQKFNERVSLHKSNIKIPANRKLFVSKHIFSCGKGKFRIIPFYQSDNLQTLGLKELHFINKFKPSLNRP